MSKAPAFQLYVGDFLSDPLVDAMSPEELGGYFRLLLVAWKQEDTGYLPSDQRMLAAWSRLGARWAECSAAIMCCFKIATDGRFYQKRMVEVAAQQEAYRDKQKAKADARWSSGNATAYAVADAAASSRHMPEACSSSSSSSLSPTERGSSVELPQVEQEEFSLAPQEQEDPGAVAKREMAEAVTHYQRRWVETFRPADGKRPSLTTADRGQLRAMLKSHGMAVWRDYLERFLADRDPRLLTDGHALAFMPRRVNGYRSSIAPHRHGEPARAEPKSYEEVFGKYRDEMP